MSGVERTEEEKNQHGAGNLKDLQRFFMEEWSLISSGVLQTHQPFKTQSCCLGKKENAKSI